MSFGRSNFDNLQEPQTESADVYKSEFVLQSRIRGSFFHSDRTGDHDDDITDRLSSFPTCTLEFSLTYLHLLPHVAPSHLGDERILVLRSKLRIWEYYFPLFASVVSVSLSPFRSFSCCHCLPHLHCSPSLPTAPLCRRCPPVLPAVVSSVLSV